MAGTGYRVERNDAAVAAYVFETNGTDGYLFTSAGGPAGSITDAVKLAGVTSFQVSDIQGGAVA